MEEQCIRVVVSGRVQGVNFRASAQEQAKSKGISGYAKNLSNGGVEIVACGDESAIEWLVEWLHKGPAQARVDEVKVESIPYKPRKEFSVK
ncbi:acylphosphatase [Marinobacter fonticola]|uniref:acylphosphatase n=1 Tax=Marinobacter fonticola TaxID=2603215 RepID=UPI0011E7DDA1|nr:acylphosphatase [Marinobacter fonticola]